MLVFTCARAIGELWSIFFRCQYFKSCSIFFSLNSMSLLTISITSFAFSFAFSYLLIEEITWFAIWLFLLLLALIKCSARKDGLWYPKYSINNSFFFFNFFYQFNKSPIYYKYFTSYMSRCCIWCCIRCWIKCYIRCCIRCCIRHYWK